MDETETTAGAPVDTTATTEVTTDVTPVTEPVDSDAAALAAFDQGIAEVAPVATEATPAATTAADVAAAAAATKVTTPADAAAPAAGGAPLVVDHGQKPDAPAKVDDVAKVEVQPDPETDAAVTELGLKGKAETRFREMAGTIKTQAQELEPLRVEADRGREWERLVTETKATPEQFSQSLGYLSYINSGDPKKMGEAFDFLLNELTSLGKNIGREVPGLVDPIADHEDLKQAVTFGEMTRAAALELAQRRTAETRNTERATATEQQTLQQQEFDKGMTAVADLSTRLKAENPALFQAKLEVLAPLLDQVRQTVAPSKWVATIEDIYKRIQVTAPVAAAPAPAPAARPPVGAMPLRATGSATSMQRSLKGADEMDAFNMGLESVNR
jgi:hypothetical protein